MSEQILLTDFAFRWDENHILILDSVGKDPNIPFAFVSILVALCAQT